MNGISHVATGIEVLRESGFEVLLGKRVGVFANPSAVDGGLTSTYDILRRTPEIHLTALFSPEHGFAAAAPDGELMNSSTDPRTGLPIHSLYGETQRPTEAMLANVDTIVCDIQDIGVRYYTFAWTVSYILEAAGEYGQEVIILDRPNPLGDTVAGGPLDMQFASLVGRFSVPIQHGMTLGELMQLFNATWNPTPCKLTIIPCRGYQRKMRWKDTGLTFVPPSPNMPHLATAQHYPGSCLIEGTSLAEGRGTPLPFEVVGAPHIDGNNLADLLNQHSWAGVRFRPHVFKPTASKYAGQTCSGVQVHIIDEDLYDPLQVWLNALATIYQAYLFTWNTHHFDRLVGSDVVRQCIENGSHLDNILAEWQTFCNEFKRIRQSHLIYT